MFSRSLLRTSNAVRNSIARRPLPTIRSASLFTASIGLGTCPKRRRKQSNEESGEDAYFINSSTASSSSSSNGGSGDAGTKIWAGVFDGVGGWADMGVDPAVFAHGLAKHCDAASESHPNSSPTQILTLGYDRVQKDAAIQLGSSTACIASVDLDSGRATVANLGDSGYFIANADGELKYTSTPQTYFFNAPYQLAKMPPTMRKPGSLENAPSDAHESTHTLTHNDLLILATDGFFDNIYPSPASALIADLIRRQEPVEVIAKRLMEVARDAGRSKRDGPFAEEARRARLRFEGGKEDDICVVVIHLKQTRVEGKSKL